MTFPTKIYLDLVYMGSSMAGSFCVRTGRWYPCVRCILHAQSKRRYTLGVASRDSSPDCTRSSLRPIQSETD